MTTSMMIHQCKAELLRVFRNGYYIFWSLIMPILFYFIFTKVLDTGTSNPKLWQAHYLMSMTTFSVMGSAIMSLGIRLVQEQTQGWTTFLRLTPLPSAIYFISKMFAQMMVQLFSILCIFIAGYLMNGVSLTLLQWMLCGSWILIGSLPFLAIGTLVGTMKRVDTASGISNVLYLLLAVSGGMWMPMEVMPTFIQQIAKWLPSYSFGNGAWNIVHGEAFAWHNVIVLTIYLIIFMILSIYVRKRQQVV